MGFMTALHTLLFTPINFAKIAEPICISHRFYRGSTHKLHLTPEKSIVPASIDEKATLSKSFYLRKIYSYRVTDEKGILMEKGCKKLKLIKFIPYDNLA